MARTTIVRWTVRLAVALTLLLTAAPGAAEAVKPPVRVSFQRSDDGGLLRGRLSAWDREGFTLLSLDEDTRVRHDWSEVRPRSAFEVLRRLIDRRSADAWLELGLLMISLDEAEAAGNAFRVAQRLDPGLADDIDRARKAHRENGDPYEAAREQPPAQQAPDEQAPEEHAPPRAPDPPENEDVENEERPAIPGIRTPSRPDRAGAEADARPWPTLTPVEHQRRTEHLREQGMQWLQRIGLRMPLVETEHYMLFTDLPATEARRWSQDLDRMHRTVATMLEMDPHAPLFAGKCVIYIFRERSDFLRFEKEIFDLSAERFAGVCHMRGDQVHIAFFRPDDATRFQSVLIHETVHGFFYRYRTPRHLPEWANEGLADYIAGVLTPRSSEPQSHWQHALQFVRSGGRAIKIMRQTYEDGTWFTNDSYPVSHMLVRFMLKHEPRRFKEWIDAVKDGADWRNALLERFNVTPERLSEGFGEDITSERGFTRLH